MKYKISPTQMPQNVRKPNTISPKETSRVLKANTTSQAIHEVKIIMSIHAMITMVLSPLLLKD
jgi:hypothetical protein